MMGRQKNLASDTLEKRNPRTAWQERTEGVYLISADQSELIRRNASCSAVEIGY